MGIPELDVTALQQLLAGPNPPRLIDVREQEEWEICRIPGAELLPLSQWPDIATRQLTDPGQKIMVYCHHGMRSARAVNFLLRAGFTDVTNVGGGIDAWSRQVDSSVARY